MKDSIDMNFREIGFEGMTWIQLAQDKVHWRALVKTELNIRIP
jgi:hypothetical protein